MAKKAPTRAARSTAPPIPAPMPALAPVERPPPPWCSVDGWRPADTDGVDVTVVTTVVAGTEVVMAVVPVLTLV